MIKIHFPDDLEGYKEIPGFPGYLINEYGKVYSVYYKKHCKGAISKKGYNVIRLSKDNNKTFFFAHNLVLKTFKPEEHKRLSKTPYGPAKERYVTNHIDGNKLNNHVSNLEVITQYENTRHAIENGLVGHVIPLVIKDYHTGEISRFPNTRELSRF